MCTVTIIPKPVRTAVDGVRNGFRLVCNRDEQRNRPDAQPPRWRGTGDARAIWPADGEAGGTWVAAHESGLTLCLLNRNPTPAPNLPEVGLVSRGKIIPELLQDAVRPMSGARMATLVGEMDLDAFAPFRLLAVDPRGAGEMFVQEMDWDRREFVVRTHAATPLCFASSGLGDDRVVGRLDLFESMVVGAGATQEAQDLFHGHTWADRPEVSVMMSRREARTVSMTHVEFEPLGAGVRMWYRPVLAEAGGAVEVPSVRTRASGSPRV
jgi:hypothetical protein